MVFRFFFSFSAPTQNSNLAHRLIVIGQNKEFDVILKKKIQNSKPKRPFSGM